MTETQEASASQVSVPNTSCAQTAPSVGLELAQTDLRNGGGGSPASEGSVTLLPTRETGDFFLASGR